MSNYIRHIIKFFSSHEVSEELTSKARQRIVQAGEEAEPAMREVWDELDGQHMDKEVVDQAWIRLNERLSLTPKQVELPMWLRIAAIWAVPILILGASFWFYQQSQNQLNGYEDVSFVHRFTAYGQRELITLPDSSKVWLNGGSTLIYPSRFAAKERNVCLTGEAYFEVTKNPRQPFIVDVNQVRLKVLGTTFNLYAYPNDHIITATLESGAVQIDVEKKDNPYILSPNDQLTYDAKTGEVNISRVNIENYLSWRSGALYFNDIQFGSAIEQIERRYDVTIHLMNNKHSEQTIRAHFSPDDSIEKVFDILRMLIPDLNYQIKGKDIYLE